MFAIYKKELKTFFNSMVGWFYLAANLFFAGWYFRMYGILTGYPYVSYVISGVMLIFLLSMPVLTMRIFAEETKLRTDQLLYTSPVPVWKIILGKYLSLLTVFSIPIIVMCLYPIIMFIFGAVPIAENYLSLLGFFLFGASCLAIGLFLSSVTDNQIIAAILTFFILLFLVMISGIKDLISSTGNVITSFLSIFDITKRLDYFLYGIINFSAIFYYFTIIFICLCLTGFLISKRRWTFNSAFIKTAISNVMGLVISLAVLIGINVIFIFVPDSSKSIDITYNGIYSITDRTKEILDGLTSDLTIYYLVDSATIDDTVEKTLTDISDYSDHIKLEYISPTDNPYFYSTYSEVNLKDNSIIVVGENKYRAVDYIDFFEISYGIDYNAEQGKYVASSYNVTGYDGEGRIMAAIEYACSPDIPKVYCITGHDELDIEPGLLERLEKVNVEIETINLLTYDEVPEDAKAVLILGPLGDFSEEEANKIKTYLEKGGSAIMIVAYSDSGELKNYYSLFDMYNIDVQTGLIIEQGSSFYNSQPYYLLPEILDTEITKDVYSNLRTKYIYIPYAQAFNITEEYNDVKQDVLFRTTENAYLLIDGEDSDESQKIPGQYALGIYAEKTTTDTTSRILAISSDYFIYDSVNTAVNGNNYTVFLKGLSKLIGTDSVSIIPVKKYSYDSIVMDTMAGNIISFIFIFLIPAFLVVVGITIWIDRRKK